MAMHKNKKLTQRVVFASKATKLIKISRFGIIVTAMITFLIFSVSFYGLETGNFTFNVDEKAKQAGISLYEDPEIKLLTSRIFAEEVDDADGMTDLCGTEYTDRPLGHKDCIPPDETLISIDGPNSGKSYIAHTFYLEMISSENYIGDLMMSLNISSTSRGAEEAMRVKLFINDIPTTYARRQTENGQNPGELEIMVDEPFYSNDIITKRSFKDFSPGDIVKFTIVVWYEGEDRDHTTKLWGGGVKLEMNFTIKNVRLLEDEL
ncbi:hypothetical protein KHQ88_02060 [Mycoplasmatota bacterium]|nr:hypothetical protein KHQ88_02060 [Mycoplasmatota bacterium]